MSAKFPDQAAADRLDRLVKSALKAGADAADAVEFKNISVGVSYRLGKLEDVGRSESSDLGLRVFVGKQIAFVSSTDFSEPALAELPERAVAMAKLAPEDKFAGLAPRDRLATQIADVGIDDPQEPSTVLLVERAHAAEQAALNVVGVTNSEGGSADYGRTLVTLATSEGFLGGYSGTTRSVAVSVIAGEGTSMERDYDYSSTRFASDLESASTVGKRAGERAVKRLNPRKVKTQSVPVFYDPRVSGGLVGHFAGAISGAAIARGVSFLKDQMGKEVFGTGISIIDDPHRKRGLRSKPFDGEGVANRLTIIADKGRLTTWLLDSASARQLGLQTTGHAARGTGGPPSPAPTNLYMAAGPLSPEDLMADVREGFYVTELIGMGVNGVTGDYSRGAAGFWIENGKLAYPVSEVTIAGNLKDMYRNLTPASDLVFRYGTDAPTIRVEGMTIAGA
ncbi:MAG: TldD/PmbA family protein [Alphaproteobacteria bacterium]|nr:TldD/PmbA family protein [Alphaproteobacteria bacterium]